MFRLLVEFKANRVSNTRTLPCRTYIIPTHSFGVRMNNPSVLYAADYCTYTPWTIAYFLIMTIGLSISWGCCRSIPIARCNRRVKYLVSISIPIYLTNTRQVQRDLHNMRLFLGELCEIVDGHLLWRMSSEKCIGTTDYCSWDRHVKLSIDTYLFLWPICSKM